MSIWLHYNEDERLVMLQQTAGAKNIVEQAVEKDWWVNAILMTLSKTSWADYLQFKGGTSLSKSWGLINRFSEDIDLAISRSFFNLPEETAQQRTAIRRNAFHYVKETLITEIDKILTSGGINGYEIELITQNSSAMIVTIEVKYKSILTTVIDYILPVVKIEISAMSLDEPNSEKEINTLYSDQIQICPPEKLQNDWRNDYENLRESFIYDKSKKTFDELITRILELTYRVRQINIKPDE